MIPIAGDQVTNDIAVSMRTPTQYAEEIKVRYACALSQLANPDESIEVPSVGDRPARRLARQTLAEVVEPRYEELFNLIREELRRSGFEEIIAAGHGADRRERAHGRGDRARRGNFSRAGAAGISAGGHAGSPMW